MTIRKFGWVPDKQDDRDYHYSIPWGVTIQPITDLSHYFPSDLFPLDQDGLGFCYAFTPIEQLWAEWVIEKKAPVELSPMMLGYLVEVIEGTVGQDMGGMPRDAIKALLKTGVCTNALWPFDPSKLGVQPPPECYAQAQTEKLLQYKRALTLDQIRGILSSGRPCGLGFHVFENFPMDSRDGMVPMPAGADQGGHDVTIVGHNDYTRRVKFLNHWRFDDGTPWGDHGYGYLPYDYFNPIKTGFRPLTGDHWVLMKVEA